jgi:hypothetical protein
MVVTVRNLIFILETFIPGDFPLLPAFSLITVLISLYPLLKLHENQRREPRQPVRTGWLKSIIQEGQENAQKVVIPGETVFTMEETDSIVDNLCRDLPALYDFLGLDQQDPNAHSQSYFPQPNPVLCTQRRNCIFCPDKDPSQQFSLRRREEGQTVWLLNQNLRWTKATLFSAHCPSCRAEYYPDKITFRDGDRLRRERFEFDTTVYRISKHGIWANRAVALAQEKAILRFRAGWSNFADWLNESFPENPPDSDEAADSTLSRKITVRQSQRLFLEHFSRRLLVAHSLEDSFSCSAHPSSDELAESVRQAIGKDGGFLPASLDHGCLDCMHPKRYGTDLQEEGLELTEGTTGVAEISPDLIQDQVRSVLFQFVVFQTKSLHRSKILRTLRLQQSLHSF